MRWTVDDLGKREALRYDAGHAVVNLGWWEGPEYRACSATLENLSQGGALLRSELAPPEGGPVWVCPAGEEVGEWVPSALVESCRLPDGSYAVRLKFDGPCPMELFRRTVREFGAGGGG